MQLLKNTRETCIAYLFILPALAFVAVFDLWPDFQALLLSFYKWNGFSTTKVWVGLDNYLRAFRDPVFLQSVGNNFTIVVGKLVFELSIAMALAVALNKKLKGEGVLRTGIFLPYITSPVVIAFVWRAIYNPNGVLNAFLELIGLPAMQTAWLGNMTTTLPALIAVSIWKDWGFSMIIFLSGLQTIPEELYEAAEIDGASSWQQFFNVTLPLLRSVGIVALIFCVINSFKLFTLVFIMTAGGPLHQSETLSTWIYKNGFQYGNLGYAAAMSFILFGIILIVTILQMKILKGDE